jgi:hypothetical protein
MDLVDANVDGRIGLKGERRVTGKARPPVSQPMQQLRQARRSCVASVAGSSLGYEHARNGSSDLNIDVDCAV